MDFEKAEKLVLQALFLFDIDQVDSTLADKPKTFGDIVFKALEIGNPALKLSRKGELEAKAKKADGELRIEITLNRMFNVISGMDDAAVRTRLIETVVELTNGMLPMLDMVVEDADRIVPEKVIALVKRAEDFALPKEGDDGNSVIRFEFGNGLIFVPVIDNPENYVFITHRIAESQGMSPERLREIALANLAKAAKTYLPGTNYDQGPQLVRSWGGHASSLLLLNDFWTKEAVRARDALLIHVADVDTLLVARMGDAAAALPLIMEPMIGNLPSMFNGRWLVFDQDGMKVAGIEDFALGRRVAKLAAEVEERLRQEAQAMKDRERREKQNGQDGVDTPRPR